MRKELKKKILGIVLHGVLAAGSVTTILYLSHARSKGEVILRQTVVAVQEIDDGTVIKKEQIPEYFTAVQYNQAYGYEGMVGDLALQSQDSPMLSVGG